MAKPARFISANVDSWRDPFGRPSTIGMNQSFLKVKTRTVWHSSHFSASRARLWAGLEGERRGDTGAFSTLARRGRGLLLYKGRFTVLQNEGNLKELT